MIGNEQLGCHRQANLSSKTTTTNTPTQHSAPQPPTPTQKKIQWQSFLKTLKFQESHIVRKTMIESAICQYQFFITYCHLLTPLMLSDEALFQDNGGNCGCQCPACISTSSTKFGQIK